MELLKLLSASQIFAQIVSFLILFFVLRAIVWKNFLKVLDSRKEKISSELKKIEEIKSDVEGVRTDYEDKLAKWEETARALAEETISDGKRIAEEIRENAKKEGQKIIDDSRELIKGEIVDARYALKEEIVDLVIDAAGHVIEERLTEDKDKKLVEEFLKGMDGVK